MATPTAKPSGDVSPTPTLSPHSIKPSNLLHPDSVLIGEKPTEGARPAAVTGNSSGSTTPVVGVDEEDEEITETKIIGVTETGVIRKRSFKV
ncbi:hypothetical protein ElyMa_003784800 [Elysia marginata]|uniref:Uncharacterized protein n=1 Tax=Elysia marginata TaxID=1093978 RepID=A0AAV4FAW7_9GAST|nr:hypothetical protein ElyMa_003784800 [Elysia marginata]